MRRFKSLAAVVDTATQPPKPGAGGAAAGGSPQFLRLPVDSARKLRYYDRPELNDLVTQHAKDVSTLLAANDALRKVRLDGWRSIRPISLSCSGCKHQSGGSFELSEPTGGGFEFRQCCGP